MEPLVFISIGARAEPLASTCAECGKTSRPTHIQRYQDVKTNQQVCADCHRQRHPRWAAIADGLEVILCAAGGTAFYDSQVYEIVAGLISRVRADASERDLDRAATSILGIRPGQKKVVDLGSADLDSEGQFIVSAQLYGGQPRIAIGDGGFPIWEDEASAAREMIQQIGDMIEIAEMAARFGGER